jgi:hypothetical protein
MQAIANAIEDSQTAAIKLLKDSDITFTFTDKSFGLFLEVPDKKHCTFEMAFNEKKACIAQALSLATEKSAQKWHEELLKRKINYTEEDEIADALKCSGFELVKNLNGVVEDVVKKLDDSEVYVLVGGSTAEGHAFVYKWGELTDTQGVKPKGVMIGEVYQKTG